MTGILVGILIGILEEFRCCFQNSEWKSWKTARCTSFFFSRVFRMEFRYPVRKPASFVNLGQNFWQNSTPRIHQFLIQFLVPFVLHNLRFWYYFSKSFVVQWLRLLPFDWLIVASNPSLAILFFFLSPKEQKNWIKMWWIGGVEFCQPSSKSQPTVVKPKG